MRRNYIIILFFTLIIVFGSFSDNPINESYHFSSKNLNADVREFIEKRLESMSLEQKIHQLYLIRVFSNRNQEYIDSITKTIEINEYGGVVFFQGTPKQQIKMVNRFNENLSIPLLVTIDAEWGLNMRLNHTLSYPFFMTLGAIHDTNKIYEVGNHIGQQLRDIGVHINFAPVVDINNNPQNPVIGVRSFGDQKQAVYKKSLAYMNGLINANVLPVAKHFPGHGDTNVDSHYDLPVISVSKKRIETLELYPYKNLIRNGLPAIMTSHINIPAYEKRSKYPATLSSNIINNLLRKEMKFKGIAITDGMDMKGVTKYFKNGKAEFLALKAGHDLLCLPYEPEKATKKIIKEIKKGNLSVGEINQKVRKVLYLKYNLGIFNQKKIDTLNLKSKLNPEKGKILKQEICDEAVTLLTQKNERFYIDPSMNVTTTLILSFVNTKTTIETRFQKQITDKYSNINTKTISIKKNNPSYLAEATKALKHYKTIIISIHDNRQFPFHVFFKNEQWGINIERILPQIKSISFFTSPYIMREIPNIQNAYNIMICYENSIEMNNSAAKVLLNTSIPIGRLPVTINELFKTGNGY